MAVIDCTQFYLSVTIGYDGAFVPASYIDESTLVATSSEISGSGQVLYGYNWYPFSTKIYGNFNLYSYYTYQNSYIFSAYLSAGVYGSYSIQNINLQVKNFFNLNLINFTLLIIILLTLTIVLLCQGSYLKRIRKT